jgi:hypothetical protein
MISDGLWQGLSWTGVTLPESGSRNPYPKEPAQMRRFGRDRAMAVVGAESLTVLTIADAVSNRFSCEVLISSQKRL